MLNGRSERIEFSAVSAVLCIKQTGTNDFS